MAIEPITREEKLLNAVANGESANIEPITREEMFLARAAGKNVTPPEPITRKEMFLNKISGGGTGGGNTNPSAKWNDVTFIDYDGTVLYSYSLEEAKQLTELPALPSHDGLVCQGWNYDLETIKSYDRPIDIGAMYITDDGKTRIYVHLEYGRTSPLLCICPNGTVTVDWGDGTEPDILTGTSTTLAKTTQNHNYTKPGDYVIALNIEGEMGFADEEGAEYDPGFIRYSYDNDDRNFCYGSSVKKIEIGKNVPVIQTYSFYQLDNLSYITIPTEVTEIEDMAFYYCRAITTVVIPNSVKSLKYKSFEECCSLKTVIIPESVTSINGSFFSCRTLPSIKLPNSVTIIESDSFYDCGALQYINIPNKVSGIGAGAFTFCYALTYISIPSSVTKINNIAFGHCPGIKCFDFTECNSVPTLTNGNAFSQISADCEMLIPAALYDEWSTATNWATYAKYMRAV